jgi:hypothetical protein
MELPSPILEFESRVHDEKQLVAASQSALKHQSGKDLFRPAMSLLSLVEGGFLCREVLEQSRSAAAWTKWLRDAESFFALAVLERKAAQRAVERFGPTVITIG